MFFCTKNIRIGEDCFGRYLRPGYPLNSQLTKTTAKKPCFSKSGDTAPIPNAESDKQEVFVITNSLDKNKKYDLKRTLY